MALKISPTQLQTTPKKNDRVIFLWVLIYSLCAASGLAKPMSTMYHRNRFDSVSVDAPFVSSGGGGGVHHHTPTCQHATRTVYNTPTVYHRSPTYYTSTYTYQTPTYHSQVVPQSLA